MDKVQISIKPELMLLLALVLLLLPIGWVLAWFGAVAFHEAFHYLALRLSGSKIFSIQLCASGAVMNTEPLNRGREFICTLAGPVGGLLLLLLSRWFPRVAICGLFQSLYNLLPIFPLDGGRAMRCVLGERICQIVEWCVLVFIVLFAIYAAIFLKLGMLPLLFAGILFFKSGKVKIPCKLRPLGLQ